MIGDGVDWLDELARHCESIEAAVSGPGIDSTAVLAVATAACPGWSVGDVLGHLGVVERLVVDWVRHGRRPRSILRPPAGTDLVAWFCDGWRGLRDCLGEFPPDHGTATWSPWEASNGFWRRKQVHEHAIHAFDVLAALEVGAQWTVPQAVALDGVDEVVRLWLGTCLGTQVRGRGDTVRLVAGSEFWTVTLNPHNAELHRLPTIADATVTADPSVLYRWLWNRCGSSEVQVDGDLTAIAVMRDALSRSMS